MNTQVDDKVTWGHRGNERGGGVSEQQCPAQGPEGSVVAHPWKTASPKVRMMTVK